MYRDPFACSTIFIYIFIFLNRSNVCGCFTKWLSIVSDGTWRDKTKNYQNAEEYKSRHSHSCHFKMIISLTSREEIRLCPCLPFDRIAKRLLQI